MQAFSISLGSTPVLRICELGYRSTIKRCPVVALKQAEVRFLEEYVKTHSNEGAAIATLEDAKAELRKIAVSAGYAD